METANRVSPDFDPKTAIPNYVTDAMDSDLAAITSRCHTSDRLIVMLLLQLVREQQRTNTLLDGLVE